MNSINFGANFVRSAQIQKLNNDSYSPHPAALVEIDLDNNDDIFMLFEVADEWGADTYASSIHKSTIAEARENLRDKNSHYYALTLQEDSFEKMETDKVLGLVAYYNGEDSDLITLFQTNPKYKHKEKNLFEKIMDIIMEVTPSEDEKREYKHIGRAMIQALRKINPNNSVEVFSSQEALDFYKKNGFRLSKLDPHHFIYNPKQKD